jgi:hypothetical protein
VADSPDEIELEAGNGRQLPLGYETQRAATRANWEFVRELTKGSQPSGKSWASATS